MHRNSFADRDGPSGGVRGLPIGYTKVPKMTFLGHKRVLWLQSGETVWNKSGQIRGDALQQFCGSQGATQGRQRAHKGSNEAKNVLFGHKLVWWLQSGGTVWNKGETSPCTAVVMHRNSFVGQVGHRGRHRARPHRLQNC